MYAQSDVTFNSCTAVLRHHPKRGLLQDDRGHTDAPLSFIYPDTVPRIQNMYYAAAEVRKCCILTVPLKCWDVQYAAVECF